MEVEIIEEPRGSAGCAACGYKNTGAIMVGIVTGLNDTRSNFLGVTR